MQLKKEEVIAFYSRDDIQKALLEASQDREVAVRYGMGGFGKRPDILQFKGDIVELAKRGATSFHISEERWHDPLQLKTGMTKSQLDANRKGWDLILDIDTPFWEYAKYTAHLLVEALKFCNIKSISVKFSGGKGFHIGVPFEAFPAEANGTQTKNLYPESLRVIAAYLQNLIKDHLSAKILQENSLENIAKLSGKNRDELIKNGQFNPFSIIDIDTILISSRHLFRAPYSLHEKTGLVSVPIEPEQILTFQKENASMNNVKAELKFLDRSKVTPNEAKDLIIQAFDWHTKNVMQQQNKEEKNRAEKSYELPSKAIGKDYFPDCITNILKGNMKDGKKRALFILLNFLRKMGWEYDLIKEEISEWNKKNPEPLRENYIQSQISWHKRQKQTLLPPNCSNSNYYKDIRICSGNNVCQKFKNPVNFAIKRYLEASKARKKRSSRRTSGKKQDISNQKT